MISEYHNNHNDLRSNDHIDQRSGTQIVMITGYIMICAYLNNHNDHRSILLALITVKAHHA